MRSRTSEGRTPTLPNKSRADLVKELIRESARRPATRISHVALKLVGKTSSLDEFRKSLVKKLEKCPYPYPPERKVRRTFVQWLEAHGALSILLGENVLRELWDTLKPFQIASEDAQFERDL